MRRTYLLLTFVLSAASSSGYADDVDFNNDVRPILSNKCLLCHGPDPDSLESGLRLDMPDIAMSTLESGNIAVVPGKPALSDLIVRITSDDEDLRMPPADHGARLTDDEIETLQKWIEQGAQFSRHWAYVKPVHREPPPPPTEYANWPKNAVDNFTLRRMLDHELPPSPEADRYAIARRVFLDLTGLPPTVEEVDLFVANKDPDAYEDLVDDLLQRPSFGEHWARKWLDLARYADSAGYADDPPRTIWAYRDWVIKAFNNNMPFDQFTIEQMAGDLLEDPSESQLIATAFHRNTLTNNEGGTQDEEFRNVAVVDRVNTTAAVWMGTTMACAQCHSHKYDPITQDEYFRFFAILNNTQDADRRDESPLVQIYTDEQKRRKSDLEDRIADLTKVISTPTPELSAAQQKWEARLQASPAWTALRPGSVLRKSKQTATILADGAVLIESAAETDTYTVDVPLLPTSQKTPASLPIAALRLETLPHELLPAKGTGHGGGNLVITGIKAQIVPAGDVAPTARFVRITNNGKKQILSLAEVQVFSGGTNIASKGRTTQHSTAFAGPPELAIDGQADGDYQKKSVTHTDTVDDPWWEVDLGGVQPIERIAIWNRTDNALHTRLNNFTVALLDADREVVWQQVIKESPNPSADYSPSNVRDITFRTAFADFHQPEFEPTDVLTGKTGDNDGWAIGGATTTAHQLLLIPNRPVVVDVPSTLRIIIEQNSLHENHLLGHFRLSTTGDDVAIQRSRLSERLLATLDSPAAERGEQAIARLTAYYRENVAVELEAQRVELVASRKQLEGMKPATSVPVLREIVGNRRETYLQFRGNYLDKGPLMNVGLPAFFNSVPEGRPLDRLVLAEWLIADDNPLTSRVLANRFWETIFGRGIVVTSEEFGSQGEPPTHPELLDWLATELLQNDWNTKGLIRTLVTSATYRQSTKVTPHANSADADNRWCSRGSRVRLSAEMVRDQALFAAGLLSEKMYGPPVKPPQPSMGLSAAFGSSTDWKTSVGEDRYRRGLYTTWRRSNPYPSMATFDAPNREVCIIRRDRTNTPLQSLVTLNDPVYVEAAQALARIALQHDGPLNMRLTLAFRRCVLRPPARIEVDALVALFNDAKEDLTERTDEATKLATDPIGELPEGIDTLDAAAMTVVCNVLLNLDEMFLKR
ncbi:MAG: DUF1553 domain-containing protein [Fuerstiella sp.]|nr:DUF1553 domain-containing protein [Fuerstiella sp.]MCP4856455.1 DUF1553 domain-containing protein [Fuerstiella sp.]